MDARAKMIAATAALLVVAVAGCQSVPASGSSGAQPATASPSGFASRRRPTRTDRRWRYPKRVAMARPTGVGRAAATYEILIEGRDEWLAAARRLA